MLHNRVVCKIRFTLSNVKLTKDVKIAFQTTVCV